MPAHITNIFHNSKDLVIDSLEKFENYHILLGQLRPQILAFGVTIKDF